MAAQPHTSCRPRSASRRVGRLQFPTAFPRTASESGPVRGRAAHLRSEAGRATRRPRQQRARVGTVTGAPPTWKTTWLAAGTVTTWATVTGSALACSMAPSSLSGSRRPTWIPQASTCGGSAPKVERVAPPRTPWGRLAGARLAWPPAASGPRGWWPGAGSTAVRPANAPCRDPRRSRVPVGQAALRTAASRRRRSAGRRPPLHPRGPAPGAVAAVQLDQLRPG